MWLIESFIIMKSQFFCIDDYSHFPIPIRTDVHLLGSEESVRGTRISSRLYGGGERVGFFSLRASPLVCLSRHVRPRARSVGLQLSWRNIRSPYCCCRIQMRFSVMVVAIDRI